MRSVFAVALMATSAFAGQAILTPANAQAAPPAGAQFSGNIRSIIIEGNVRIDERTVQSFLLVEPGDPLDQERLNLSLKTLFATGQFADVDISVRGQDLIVRVVENPIINRVLFEGNRSQDDDTLREEVQAEPRAIFTAARVQADVQRILQLYRQSGRFAAQVTPQFKPLDQGRVDLIFEIIEGPVTGVRSINFIGNEVFSDRRLRSEIATRQSRFWRFFSANDNYDPDRLAFDREQLRTFYQNRGYYDFRVTSAVADLTPDQEDFFITFTIEEGRQYEFGDISVDTTLDKLNGNRLVRAVRIQEGDLYQGDRIETAIDQLTLAAGFSGYAFVDIRPRISPNPETGKIDVVFVVDEGPRVYIERINIVGNTTTLDEVIRRELRISEGDAFNRVLLDRSRNRVRALGFFSNVEVTETPSVDPDRTIVNIAVEEQPTGELSFSAGFSSVDAFLFDVSVSQNNLRGRGQRAVASVRASARQQSGNLQFTEPRFLGRNLSAGIDAFARRTDFSDISGFESETFGGAIRAGFPLSDRAQLGLRYEVRQDGLDVTDVDVVVSPTGTVESFASLATIGTDGTPLFDSAGDPFAAGSFVADACSESVLVDTVTGLSVLCTQEVNELTSLFGYSFRYNGTNDPISPTRGFNFSLSQDIAGLGGDVTFLRTESTATFFRGLLPGVRASAQFSGGYIFPFGGDDSLRINNRFFRGGSNFRGFNVAGIGPRVINELVQQTETGDFVPTGEVGAGQSLGGQAFYQATFELTVPNFLPQSFGIRTSFFLEAGGLGLLEDADVEFSNGETFVISEPDADGFAVRTSVADELVLRSSVGVSVAWRSPFGPIRFDVSQDLAAAPFDRPQAFRFSTTTQF